MPFYPNNEVEVNKEILNKNNHRNRGQRLLLK